MKTIASFLFLVLLAGALSAAEKNTPVYELRTYWAAPGKLDDLNARFRNHTLKLFEKHGMTNIAYWMPITNVDHRLVYLLAHPSREAAQKSWTNFFADPDWQAVVKESEAKGKLVARMQSIFMTLTDFSPIVIPSTNAEPRIFELRTYKTPQGQLAPLLARFRDHTLALFKKHGMTSIGYWIPLLNQKPSDNTLIYLLAHKDKPTADASWNAFRTDPDWLAAKKASETKGSLTRQVVWYFLKPTDYSPMK